ncbi:MAG TPA: glycerophosphodiester phosphodiesterase family protein [Candidatus Nitrosopolaris sp.]|nr:glycerophosphodiester phosphodiesterase family protein [Candidatus Nitrosopolaris sp.]
MRPLVIAHRGASGTSPENTLAAFRRAVEIGADMIELDVQLTRDGAVVVIHDYTLERTTSGVGAVHETVLADLRRLDAGSWFAPAFGGERVPTLAETLDAVPLPINVELKPVGPGELEARALAVVEEAGALRRTIFSSFAMDALERVRARSAAAQLAVLWETERVEDAVAWARRVGARALHLRKDTTTPRALEAAASAQLAVRVWTVNDQAEMQRLAAAGVGGIFTDFPERFLHNPAPA